MSSVNEKNHSSRFHCFCKTGKKKNFTPNLSKNSVRDMIKVAKRAFGHNVGHKGNERGIM